MDELVDRLRSQIIESLKLTDVKPEDIDPDAPLIGGGLGLDSIDTLELIVLLERHYGIGVPDVNAGRKAFASVSALAGYIRENAQEG